MVLATTIGETSVTLEGVEVVVDSGLVRRPSSEPALGLARLEVVRVSAASAEQRAGRAGRTGPVGGWWEVADREEGQSVVARGPVRGATLAELMREWGGDLLGRAAPFEGRFPLLIKFLDARENLSVQVHPPAAVAKRMGGSVRGKHEAGYVMEVE